MSGGSDSSVHIDGGANPDGSIDASTQMAANDHCADATAISIDNAHINVPASVVGAGADLAAPCGSAGVPDVFFTFTLTRREIVYADTFGASGSTALYFASSCSTALATPTMAGDDVCSAAACSTSQSQVVALLDPGTYYLVYAGQAGATIHFQHAQIGAGSVTELAQGSSAPTGTTSGTGALYACDAGGAENSYWWRTCPGDAGGLFTASTCTGTAFDTILSLQIPGADAVMCDDDTCSFQSTVGANIPAGAGLFVVAVDGFSQAKQGAYTISVQRP